MPITLLPEAFDASIERHVGSIIEAVHLHLFVEVGYERAAIGSRGSHDTEAPADGETPGGGNGNTLRAPLQLSDGTLCGTFFCVSRSTQPEKEQGVLNMCADIARYVVETELSLERERIRRTASVENIIGKRQFSVVYQPIYRLSDGELTSFEALARFSALPSRAPDQWLAEAAAIGLGTELEFAIVHEAFAAFGSIPPEVALAVNLSPSAILDPQFQTLFQGYPVHRIIVEITEHEAIQNYGDIGQALESHRRSGLRLTVDDAGAGYSSFKHVLELKPDIIKLDASLTHDIHRDASRRTLAAALTQFAKATGSVIIAEGVETAAELDTLRALGVAEIQGYLVGCPMPLEEVTRLSRMSSATTGTPRGRFAASASQPPSPRKRGSAIARTSVEEVGAPIDQTIR
jgi:EAL domain-containing protein (putative c-di-GMP-specific phosphodiesterase class I)